MLSRRSNRPSKFLKQYGHFVLFFVLASAFPLVAEAAGAGVCLALIQFAFVVYIGAFALVAVALATCAVVGYYFLLWSGDSETKIQSKKLLVQAAAEFAAAFFLFLLLKSCW